MIEKTKGWALALFVFAVVGLFLYGHSPYFHGGGFVLLIASDAMRIALSLVLTAASLFVILRKDYPPKDKHWAYATIGTILGFWLRGGSK